MKKIVVYVMIVTGLFYGGSVVGMNDVVIAPEGYIVCDNCGGRKVVVCRACRGRKRGSRCIGCGGKLTQKCSKCSGKGYVRDVRRKVTPKEEPFKHPKDSEVEKKSQGPNQVGELSERPQEQREKTVDEVTAKREEELLNLRSKREDYKKYLRTFVHDNGIACSNRTSLADVQFNLLKTCLEEDRKFKEDMRAVSRQSDFPLKTCETLTGSFDAGGRIISIIDTKDQRGRTLKNLVISEHVTTREKIALTMLAYPYYKKNCDVHKWDEECCPKFKGDFYTEDMKAKYFSNRMKAYEMEKKGVIKCTCGIQKEAYLSAMATYKKTRDEVDTKQQRAEDLIVAFSKIRQEELRKLKAIQKANELFEKLSEIREQINSL